MKLKIIYEDNDLLVFNKPSGVNSDDFPKRVHRLDKDTSGIFLVAKNEKALDFFQKQFQERGVEKEYTALVVGNLQDKEGVIETLLGRSPKDRRKQKVYLPSDPGSESKREAKTHYKVLQRFKGYDLLKVEPKTGRKHQIRAHLAYLNHPIAGDKLYSFKGQETPLGLQRQFLHANRLKIKLPNNQVKEFESELPKDLKICLQNLKPLTNHN